MPAGIVKSTYVIVCSTGNDESLFTNDHSLKVALAGAHPQGGPHTPNPGTIQPQAHVRNAPDRSTSNRVSRLLFR